jgi:PAS domain S-box-containing protein
MQAMAETAMSEVRPDEASKANTSAPRHDSMNGDGWASDDAPLHARYQALFEFAPDCQLMTDTAGIILEANHAAAVLFGRAKDFLIGKPLGLMVSRGMHSRFYRYLAGLAQERSSAEFELRIGRDGRERDVIMRAIINSPSITTTTVYYWLIRDISHYRRSEKQRHELLRRIVSSQEEERRRISRELHDHLGQELTGLTLGLKVLEADLPAGSSGRARLRDLQDAVNRLGMSAHELAVELRPSALDDLGLQSALEDLVRRWSSRTTIPVDFHFAAPGAGRFTLEVELIVYRVVQEALTNVAKHAGASRVSVIVEHRDAVLMAMVEDDGRGFDPEAAVSPDRLGISGMHERLALVGGTLQVESSNGTGTTIRARIRCP